jgi:molybdopterin converting factor small subunit
MRVTVKLFGPQAKQVGSGEVSVDLDQATPNCAALREKLPQQQPALADSLPHSRFAVNYEYVVDEQAPIDPSDEVALIGMVSGG